MTRASCAPCALSSSFPWKAAAASAVALRASRPSRGAAPGGNRLRGVPAGQFHLAAPAVAERKPGAGCLCCARLALLAVGYDVSAAPRRIAADAFPAETSAWLLPAPPPAGVSSTARCFPRPNSRIETARSDQIAASSACPERDAANGPGNISGKRVSTVARHGGRPSLVGLRGMYISPAVERCVLSRSLRSPQPQRYQ